MKRLLLFILLLESVLCKAQTFCHTPQITDESNNRALNLRLMQKRDAAVNNSMYRLRVYMHVIRKSNGTGGHSYQDILNTMNVLNSDFNPYDIYFIWNNTIDYIDNTSYFYNPSSSIFSVNNHANGIDIYLFPDEVGNPGGQANGVGISSEFYVGGKYWESPYPSLVPSHVVSHEMGHVLYLWHTHHGTYPEGGDSNQCAELVNGTNSDVCGDYIEDTPADPHLNFNVNITTYEWLGSEYDQNGDPYTPDTRQIMSYTDPRCMNHFSSLQGERMRAAIESLTHLQSALMPFIDGPSFPCGEDTYKVESIPNGCNTIWSWKDGSSLPIVQDSPSDNQCTITNNNHAYINDTLVATVYKNNSIVYTLEKEVRTGCNFSGTCEQSPYNYGTWNFAGQTATPFYDGDTFGVYKGTTITLRSSAFNGANVTHSGATPLGWVHSGDSITFSFRYFQPDNPYRQSQAFPINGSMTINVINNQTCEYSQFTVVGTNPIPHVLSSSPYFQLSRQGQQLIFSRNAEDEEYSIPTGMNTNGLWTLTITNFVTGQLMFQSKSDADSQEVDIHNWPLGFYAATIQIGNTSSTIKFKL